VAAPGRKEVDLYTATPDDQSCGRRTIEDVRIASAGHAVFAATLIVLGVLGLITGNFNSLWLPVPKGMPAREALAYLTAVISVAAGIGLLWQRTAAPAARVLVAYFLLWLLTLRLPAMLVAPDVETSWAASKTAVMLAAAWVLYVWFATPWDKQRLGAAAGDNGLRVARVLYALALIPFGLAHFAFLNRTASLVPGWLPSHVAWANFTGWAFIAAGVGMLVGVCARLAAALSALEMGLFLLLVWIPIMAAGSRDAFQWGETIVTWVLTAAAWVVADSYRGVPWLAVDKR
jgi:uncharacterized membrane protein